MERSPRTSDPQWQMLTQHSLPAHLETLDHLATMVSVVTPEGLSLYKAILLPCPPHMGLM